MYLPIPSLCNKYEISPEGKVRNAKTKRILKSFLRRGKIPYVQVYQENNRLTARSIWQLLWEVHGKIPPADVPEKIGVYLQNGSERLYFDSLTKAACYLAKRLNYTSDHVIKKMTKRVSEFHGWRILYSKQAQRKIRSVDAILESKYFYRENKYWRQKE